MPARELVSEGDHRRVQLVADAVALPAQVAHHLEAGGAERDVDRALAPRAPEGVRDQNGDRPPLPEEAITLDDPAALSRIDASDMLGRVREMPRQLAQARRIAAATTVEPRYRDVDAVLVLGMVGFGAARHLVPDAAWPTALAVVGTSACEMLGSPASGVDRVLLVSTPEEEPV